MKSKSCEGKCPICGSEIVKDFIDAKHDRICKDCLDDMKELTTDMQVELPKWIITDFETMRKVLIMKHLRKDFPEKYEQIKRDFIRRKNRYCGEDNE